MPTKRFSGITLLLVSITTLGLTSVCQANEQVDSEPLTIIYGFKEGKTKSIYLSDEQGKRRIKLVDATVSDGYPAASPTGKQIAFYGKYDNYKTWSIHTADIDGTNMRRLTNLKHVWDYGPAFSPDGKTIAFGRDYRDDNGKWQEEIWLMNADGTDQRQIKGLAGGAPEFMPDGRLLFQSKGRYSKSEATQIGIANIDGSNMIQLTNDDTNNYSPKISPDGSQIAYTANRDGNQEIYVMDVDGSNQTRLTKNSIDEWGAAWTPDGTKVSFSSQNVHGFYDIYKVNKDGSDIKKILSNGSQASMVSHIDKRYLDKLIKARQQ